jgi:Rrf2 family protein
MKGHRMTQFGARVEYALHILLTLSFVRAGTAPSARDLAEFQKLPLAFVRKLLTDLEKTGLIVAAEGVHGGWRLGREPGEVSVLDVVLASGGESELFDCRGIRVRCALWDDDDVPRAAREGVCEIHAVMIAAEQAMRSQLASHSLDDIAARVRAKSPRYATSDVPTWFTDRYSSRTGAGSSERVAKDRTDA